jgi:HEAT repeat protein
MIRRTAIILAIALAGCGGPPPSPHQQAVAEQMTLLAHADSAIRAKAATALAVLAPADEAVGALTKALRDRDAPVREAAARTLGELRSAAAAGDLAALVEDREPAVRAAAMAALAVIDPAAVVAPAGRLLGDGDPVVRQAAARALASAGPAGLQQLVTTLSSGGPAAAAAAEALARQSDPAAAKALIAAVASTDAATRAAALAACGDARLTAAVPAIVPLLTTTARGPAIATLGRIGGADAAAALLPLLGGTDGAAAADALRVIGPAGVPAMLSAAATTAGPDPLAGLVVDLLPASEDAASSQALLDLLARCSDPRPLATRLRETPARARAASLLAQRLDKPTTPIIAALGEVGSPGGAEVAALLAQATAKPPAIRGAALAVLVRIGAREAIPLLRSDLSTTDGRDLSATINGLAKLDDPDLAADLVRILTQRTGPNIWHAAQAGLPALARLDKTAALPVLRLWILDNPNMPDLRQLAVGLASKQGADGLGLVAEALAAPDLSVDWRLRQVVPVLRTQGAAAAPALAALLSREAISAEDDPGWWAAELLAEAGDPAPVLAIDRIAAAPRLRARILRALCMPRQPTAVAVVATGLVDPDPVLRRTAAGLIGRHRLPCADALRSARASETDPAVQAAMNDALLAVEKP